MNSKINLFLAIAALILLSTSCSFSLKTISREAKSIEIPSEPVIQKPLVGELEVSKEKVNVVVKGGSAAKSLELLKQEALTKAVKETLADVIVEPLFDIEYKNTIVESVSLQGYPAKYTRFRPIQESDTIWTKNGILKPQIGVASNPEKAEAPAKKSTAGIWWGTIGGTVLLVAALCLIPLMY